jgi:epoxyqueuosine reductase
MADLFDSRANTVPVDHAQLQTWAIELGFSRLGVADIDLSHAQPGLAAWIAAGHHGELDYMVRHGSKRWQPAELLPGTISALMATIDYAPQSAQWQAQAWATLHDSERAFVSRYALGRDYHKVVRSRLNQLALRIEQVHGPFIYRPFCDSAPVMEVELARKAGLGWRGKHSLLLNREQGSMFFIGTLYTSLSIAVNEAVQDDGAHCGQCQRCLQVCPTQAIVAPYRVDARRCISYLTIELKGSIPIEFRPAIGNRIYGCDDCQLVCPWNKYAVGASVGDFAPRNDLDAAGLADLFDWSEADFALRTAGSSIARIGYERWLRNLAVAIGNSLAQSEVATGPTGSPEVRERLVSALRRRSADSSPLVREHVQWALTQAA